MPSYPCKHPTCNAYVGKHGEYCPNHLSLKQNTNKTFYNSKPWKIARQAKIDTDPICEICGRFAQQIHHLIPVSVATPLEKISQSNLQSLCITCHNLIEKNSGKP